MQSEKNQMNQDIFSESKLFTQALSQQSSHYIQSKLLSLPKQSQDLKKLDLRHMCDTVVKQLELVQKQAAYDYIKVSQQLESLGQQLTVADNIMEQLQKVLYDFKDHLQTIKSQMTSLQEKSNKMNTSLNNKKKIQGLLNSFIESAVLDKELIDAICLGEINDNYVNHIKALLKKLSYLNSNLIAPDSKAVKELQPELQKLKARASVRLRQFLLQQINLLKKPKTNIQIVQKNVLGKYRVFTEFFKDQFPQIYTQLCNNYREIMAKIYINNYKIYLSQIFKLQTELYTKTDQILPIQAQNMRQFLTQIKPTNLNQDKKSIFFLMNRDRLIDQNEATDVILYNVASQKGQKFTLEQTFKSINKSLMDGVLHEIIFTAQFFNVKSEGAVEIFGPLFRPSYQIFLEHIKDSIKGTFDIYSILLMLAINQRNQQSFQEKGCTALDYYFNQVSMILWPKFEQLFEFHFKAMQVYTPLLYNKLEKSSSTKIIVDRFADFIVSFYRLYIFFPNSKMMMEKRLQTIRKCFFDLIKRVRSQFEKESQGLSFYLNILQHFHFACTSDSIVVKFKQFHVYQNELEKQITQYADKVVVIYMREYFVSLDGFIKKYCKEDGAFSEQTSLSIQGTVDMKTIESTISDLSTQIFSSKMQKLVQFVQKQYSGYSLKLILKKFMNIFMKYYNEIYKYIKNNHPDCVTTMLQPHNMMKELKNLFAKYNI